MNSKIGYAQFHPRFGEREANLERIRRLAEAAEHADLLVFPELAVSGYDFHDASELKSLAEPFASGPTSETALDLARSMTMTLVVGYPEASGDRCFNSCLLAAPDGILVNYRKIQLFSREALIFSAGDAPPPVVQTPVGRVGLMICFDWVYPEIARTLALGGAQILAHPSNLVLPYCQRAMFCRSVENGVFSITANRIGTEARTDRSLTFTGGSQVLDPRGERLVDAPADEEHLGLVMIDPQRAEDKRLTEQNNLLADRRPELYRQ